MVIANGRQVLDLYVHGELTDSEGRRWDIAILPGIVPTARVVGRSWRRAGRYYDGLFSADGVLSSTFRWSYVEVAEDFMIAGIGRDYRAASDEISSA